MYRIADVLSHEGPLSMVVEVSFHPSGAYFAATYENTDEVRIYDSTTRKLLHVLKNPDAQLDHPHGLLVTEKHLLVGNVHNFERPGTINIYRNGDSAFELVRTFQTPFPHLREPHSFVLRNGVLVVTYCENVAPSGAVVSYAFDDDTGEIGSPLDKVESCFSRYGDSKGVSFNGDGTKLFVTFESDRHVPPIKQMLSILSAKSALSDRLRILSTRTAHALAKRIAWARRYLFGTRVEAAHRQGAGQGSADAPRNYAYVKKPTKNGVAVFAIGPNGKIGRSPERLILRKEFCRLENINILGQACVITNASDRSLSVYDLAKDPSLRTAVQTVDLGDATPHGAKFSPDGKLLIVSCLGLKVVNQEIKFFDWETPRQDNILVFERAV